MNLAIESGRWFVWLAVFGFAINFLGMCMFAGHGHGHSHGGHGHSHGNGVDVNMRAIFLHFVGDCISSVCVLITGLLIDHQRKRKWIAYVDPCASVLITIIILYTTIPLVKYCSQLVLQSGPQHVDYALLRKQLRDVRGVHDIHSLHVWQLNPSRLVSSVHVVLTEPDADADAVGVDEAKFRSGCERRVREVLHEHGLHYTCIQLEDLKDQLLSVEKGCANHCVRECHAMRIREPESASMLIDY
eukprot:TRINITY_DN55880_c0_g1_i2.p1 TRINITY_DN55880_c0_g1~~TRINITY_DN55880_c0_g1_i2.p1  ORF type:complete len:244 (+),score=117.62 TRINITY_DN55880_c0_g1_i2:78-809(+)